MAGRARGGQEDQHPGIQAAQRVLEGRASECLGSKPLPGGRWRAHARAAPVFGWSARTCTHSWARARSLLERGRRRNWASRSARDA